MIEMKKRIWTYVKKSLILLILFGILATGLMIAVWSIPQSAVQDHIDGAWEIFRTENAADGDIKFFSYSYGTKLIADVDMMKAAVASDDSKSIIYKAMDINGYSRYWHGYLVILRPLLVIFTYGQFRYLMSAAFILLIIYISVLLKENFGTTVSMAFAISLIAVNILAVPFSFHVSVCILEAFFAMLYILKKYRPDQDVLKDWSFYLTIGAITSYIDFLTTPILTLALPLLIQIMLNIKADIKNCKSNMITCIKNSAAWCIGYAVFWAEKWLIGSMILHRNVLVDGLDKINKWETAGNGTAGESYSRAYALAKNFLSMIPFGSSIKEAIPFFIIIGIVIVSVAVYIIKKMPAVKRNMMSALPMLFVSLYPYFWIAAIQNHSTIHATLWVYRIQLVFIFGIISTFCYVTGMSWSSPDLRDPLSLKKQTK